MTLKIVTKTLEVDDLWDDLRINIDLFKQMSIDEVLILFGFAWGNFIYEKDWIEQSTSTYNIESLILTAEKDEHGQLGFDDLYIKIPNLNIELQYCHETDIHLTYLDTNELIEAVSKRWTLNGWLDKNYQC